MNIDGRLKLADGLRGSVPLPAPHTTKHLKRRQATFKLYPPPLNGCCARRHLPTPFRQKPPDFHLSPADKGRGLFLFVSFNTNLTIEGEMTHERACSLPHFSSYPVAMAEHAAAAIKRDRCTLRSGCSGGGSRRRACNTHRTLKPSNRFLCCIS